MNVGKARIVHNLYEWLPSYGETRVSFRCSGLELVVSIVYDSATGVESSRTITFGHVCFYNVSLSPGVNLLDIEYDDVLLPGNLIEFENSSAAAAWNDYVLLSPIYLMGLHAMRSTWRKNECFRYAS
jgi:hypothetical protein